DKQLAERCRSFRNLCFKPEQRFVHDELGWNFRMSNLQAAVGVAQLERLDEFISKKRALGHLYTKQLAGIPNIDLPIPATPDSENNYWVYGVVLHDNVPFDADEAIKRLAARNVGSRPFF